MCCKCATVTDAHITTSISVLECPMLQTMQPFFILSSCSLVTTFLLPIFKKDGEFQSVTIKKYFLLWMWDKCGWNNDWGRGGTSAGDHHVHLPDDFAKLDHSEAVHAAQTHTDVSDQQIKGKEGWLWMGGKQMHETHQACRAQMGSISVTHTMAPRAFRAVQQPFPTYTAKDRESER